MRLVAGLLLLGSMCVACAAEPAPAPFQSNSRDGQSASSDDSDGDDSHSGTAPAPSSSVAQPVIPSTPTQPVDTTPTSTVPDTKWTGTLAKTTAVTFGGSPYCTYRTHLENVSVTVTTDADGIIKGATVTGKAVEEALNNCPNKPIPANNHVYAFIPASPITGGFSTEGATANQPRALLNATVKADDTASTGTVTLAIHRDDIGSPFDWTITATVSLAKK